MTFDFRASQLRTSKIVASGSTGTNGKLLLYPISAQGSPLNQGNIDPTLFETGSIGQDVFMYVSGGIGGIDGTNHDIAVFGGDVYVSGTLKAEQQIRGTEFVGVSDPDFWFLVDAINGTFHVASGLGGVVGFQSEGNISFKDGSVFSGSLSSSLTDERVWRLPDASGDIALTNRVLAGTGVTINAYPDGYVAISSSVTSSIFEVSGGEAKTTYRVSVDNGDNRYPSAIGSDVWWFVSGSSTRRSVFGGDLVVSGIIHNSGLLTLTSNLPLDLTSPASAGTSSYASREDHQHKRPTASEIGAIPDVLSDEGDLVIRLGSTTTRFTTSVTGRQIMQIATGSEGYIMKYISGNPFWVNPLDAFSFQAGPFITINTSSVGVVQISSSLNFLAGPGIDINTNPSGTITISGSSIFYQSIASYTSTIVTSAVACGQGWFEPTEVPTGSIYFRVILSTTTGSNTAYVQLFNITSQSYVHIGGPGITDLSSSAITGSKVQSVALGAATNWSTGSSVYEVQIFTSSSSYPAILGTAQFVFGSS